MSPRLRVLLVLALAAGVAAGWLTPSTRTDSSALAQGISTCPLTDCDFACLNQNDAWYGWDGVWLIVHAKPFAPTGELRWWDTGGAYWAPMEIVGTWKEPDGGTLTGTITVNDRGACDDSDANGWIRCHGDIATDPDFLCDYYGGVWGKDHFGNNPSCLIQTNQGFDFQKEFVQDGKTYCFQKADVYSVQPNGSQSLKPRTKNPNGSCDSPYGTRFITESQVVWMCQAKDEQRPGGSVDRLDVTLKYNYEQ
jgi:hypothetical protein